MNVLGLDTATPATVTGVLRADGVAFEARHEPEPGERPGHATHLLGLAHEALAAAELGPSQLQRIAVGVGPGSFTGLRIGIATARGLAQGWDVELVGVSTLRVLAERAFAEGALVDRALATSGSASSPPASGEVRPIAAVIDARRGEVFAGAWAGAEERLAPAALAPEALAERLAELGPGTLAVGDGALRFRRQLEPAGAAIPPDDDPLHRVAARQLCRLGAEAEPPGRDAVLPRYLRLPDAEARRLREVP